MIAILYVIATIMIVLWLAGFVFHVFMVGVGFGIHAFFSDRDHPDYRSDFQWAIQNRLTND